MKNRSRGYVTIIVIWVAALLVVISGGLILYVRYQTRALKNYENYLKSYYIAAAGAYDVIYTDFAKKDKLKLSTISGINELNAVNAGVSFGEGTYTAVLEDEGGKSNINNAPIKVIRDILKEVKIGDYDKKSQAILNWRKQNGGVYLNVEELGLVPDMDVNDVFTLLPYFTVYDSASGSQGALNINTATLPVLKAYIKEFNGPDTLADLIVSKRPISSQAMAAFIRQNGRRFNPRFVRYFCVESMTKRVRVASNCNGAMAKVNAVFNTNGPGEHEKVFIRYFWQE